MSTSKKIKTQTISFFKFYNNDKGKVIRALRTAYPKNFKVHNISVSEEQFETLTLKEHEISFTDEFTRNFVINKNDINNYNLFFVTVISSNGYINLNFARHLFFKNNDELNWIAQQEKITFPPKFIAFIRDLGLDENDIKILYNL
jgi:hypothetical protein